MNIILPSQRMYQLVLTFIKHILDTIEISNGNNKTTIGAKSIASPSVSATAVYGNSVATLLLSMDIL